MNRNASEKFGKNKIIILLLLIITLVVFALTMRALSPTAPKFKNMGTSPSTGLPACAAVLTDVFNADSDGISSGSLQNHGKNGIHVSDIMFAGKLTDISSETITGISAVGTPLQENVNDNKIVQEDVFAGKEISVYKLAFNITEVEPTYPEYADVGDAVEVYYLIPSGNEDRAFYDSWQVGSDYLIRAFYDAFTDAEKQNLVLEQLTGGVWFIPLNPDEKIDFSTTERKELLQQMEAQNENRHSVFLSGIDDMQTSSLFAQNGDYRLTAGRMINSADNTTGVPVCVIREEFAQLRGLTPGQNLSLTFRDADSSYLREYITNSSSNWKELATKPDQFLIVGTYTATQQKNYKGSTSFDYNEIFIPTSCLPKTEEVSKK